VLVNLLRPARASTAAARRRRATNLKTASLSLKEFVTHLVPKSVFEAMAQNEILQIVVFAVFFGVAAAALGERAKVVVQWVEEISHVMLKVTGYVMGLAPLAVFAAIASTVTTQGLGILWTYGKFMGEFYLGLVILWDTARVRRLPRARPADPKAPVADQGADHARVQHRVERGGIPEDHGAARALRREQAHHQLRAPARLFVQPRRLDDVLHVRRAVHRAGLRIELTTSQQITMLLILMVTSKGMAGVPRASLVVIAATLSTFNIPEAGLLLIMGIDQFLDMGRSATNVVGNSIATAVVAKWEGELKRRRRRRPRSTATRASRRRRPDAPRPRCDACSSRSQPRYGRAGRASRTRRTRPASSG
jgi:hypothetical protein